VLRVDEKSWIGAIERKQPNLPLGSAMSTASRTTIRHGTTTLFAAVDIQSGEVLTQCKCRHQEFLSFLEHINASVPARFDVHLVLDNYAAHKHANVKAWLARQPRLHLHCTPTYASWLNQVERWFGLITQRAIRRSLFPRFVS